MGLAGAEWGGERAIRRRDQMANELLLIGLAPRSEERASLGGCGDAASGGKRARKS